MMDNINLILPEIAIALTAIIILLFGSRLGKFSGYLAVFGILISVATLLAIPVDTENGMENPKSIMISGIKMLYSRKRLMVIEFGN